MNEVPPLQQYQQEEKENENNANGVVDVVEQQTLLQEQVTRNNDMNDHDDNSIIRTYYINPIPPTHLNLQQIHNVDTKFKELFGYKWGTQFDLLLNDTNNHHQMNDTVQEQEQEMNNKNAIQCLRDMFGSKITAKILYQITSSCDDDNNNNTNTEEKRKATVIDTTEQQPQQRNNNRNNNRKRKRLLLSCNHISNPQQSQQLKSINMGTAVPHVSRNDYDKVLKIPSTYSLKSINDDDNVNHSIYEKLSTQSSQQQQQHLQPPHPPHNNNTTAGTTTGTGTGGVDNILQQIALSGTKISTVAKTSADWDQYKNSIVGLSSKLEEHVESKDSYLKKQDFLSRVDHRQFNIEKSARDYERAKRGI